MPNIQDACGEATPPPLFSFVLFTDWIFFIFYLLLYSLSWLCSAVPLLFKVVLGFHNTHSFEITLAVELSGLMATFLLT